MIDPGISWERFTSIPFKTCFWVSLFHIHLDCERDRLQNTVPNAVGKVIKMAFTAKVSFMWDSINVFKKFSTSTRHKGEPLGAGLWWTGAERALTVLARWLGFCRESLLGRRERSTCCGDSRQGPNFPIDMARGTADSVLWPMMVSLVWERVLASWDLSGLEIRSSPAGNKMFPAQTVW